MLEIQIVDDECPEGEAYIFTVPKDTPWFKIEAGVSLFYPGATSVLISIKEE